MKKRRAVNGKVLIEEIKEGEKKTNSGIILPTVGKKTTLYKGRVVMADEDVKLTPGEVVFYKPGAGTPTTLDDKEYLSLRYTEIELVESELEEEGHLISE